MDFQKCVKESFTVIGKEGSTKDGEGFIQALWADANGHFGEVAPFAKTDDQGNLVGIWGAMSDLSRSFKPWENGFSQGLYLAGIECVDDAQAPEGWTKWVIPAFEYVYVENTAADVFPSAVAHLGDNNLALAGAAHEFNCPQTGTQFLFFPIRKL